MSLPTTGKGGEQVSQTASVVIDVRCSKCGAELESAQRADPAIRGLLLYVEPCSDCVEDAWEKKVGAAETADVSSG